MKNILQRLILFGNSVYAAHATQALLVGQPKEARTLFIDRSTFGSSSEFHAEHSDSDQRCGQKLKPNRKLWQKLRPRFAPLFNNFKTRKVAARASADRSGYRHSLIF